MVNYSAHQVTVDLPHYKYVDKVMRSNSFEELWWRFKEAESPIKEISESYAAFHHVRDFCQVNNFTWLHIGDGGHTRTAAIFSFFSKSLNFSIDPALNLDKFNNWIELFKSRGRNITGIVPTKCRFGEVNDGHILKEMDNYKIPNSGYNITCVHAHVNLEEVDKHFPYWTYLYTNPCCHPEKQTFSDKYMKENGIIKIKETLDLGILSDKRNIYVYKKSQL
jgi:hypothetical protein